MPTRDDRRVAAALAAVALLAVGGGCSRPLPRDEPPREPLPLLVRNHGFFDVSVDLMGSGGARGRRIATVTGYSSVELTVRWIDLQPPHALAVRVHAIGTRFTWFSPSVAVGPGMTSYLDVYSDHDGDLNRSSLWAAPTAASARPSSAAVELRPLRGR